MTNKEQTSYVCECGITLTNKVKSLKKHIQTQKHLKALEIDCPPHHWSIATATGPISQGTCIKCNLTKNFENSVQYTWSWQTASAEKIEQEKAEKADLEHQLIT